MDKKRQLQDKAAHDDDDDDAAQLFQEARKEVLGDATAQTGNDSSESDVDELEAFEKLVASRKRARTQAPPTKSTATQKAALAPVVKKARVVLGPPVYGESARTLCSRTAHRVFCFSVRKKPEPVQPAGLSLLAGYGSDSE